MLIFYDFEVFKNDWLVVFKEITGGDEQETVIVNDRTALEAFHDEHLNKIWVGFNSRHYDQWILKAILCDFNPKEMNDWIIDKGKAGWQFSSLLRNIPLNNYDVMTSIDRGLKTFEGFMGNNIKESSVPFNIDRPLTEKELQEVIDYCRYDVEQTQEIFLQRLDDFEAHRDLVKLASDDGSFKIALISKTKPQLSAQILSATKRQYNDEFDIDFPPVLRVEKYTAVVDWYKDPANRKYKVDPNNPKSKNHNFETIIAGVPHVFGWGGIHGALTKYNGQGHYINMDVASYYPSLMIQYGLLSRSIKNPAKFEEIYHSRLKYKQEGNKLEKVLKLLLNSTYGVMKDKSNPLYDPLQANRVCIFGQLLLLDLMERLETHCEIIQSNTDGVLIKLRRYEDYDLIDDICYEWEQRTRMTLEFKEFHKIYQKDVNNYIIIEEGNKIQKSIGAYIKKLNPLDYDLPIINKALIAYMVHGTPVEKTINECTELKEFQLIAKISGKYTAIYHGDKELKEKCIRIFASKNESDAGVFKLHATRGTFAKLSNSPHYCFIHNEEINGVKIPDKLDKRHYIDMAYKRLADFGVR